MILPKIINEYVFTELGWSLQNGAQPFFPIHDSTGIEASWENNPYVVYDWIKMRNDSAFHPIKTHQLIYSIRGTVPQIYAARDAIIDRLDREDESGQMLNKWQKDNNHTDCAYFYISRAWQSGRVLQPDSTKQYYVLPMILEFELSTP